MAGQLTEQEKADIKAVFDSFDKDGNKSISSKELGAVMKACGQNLSKDQLDNLMKAVDTNNSGCIDFSEFCTMMVSAMNAKPSEDDMLEAFKACDKDGNGYLSKSEIKTVMADLNIKLSDEDVNNMIKQADKDGDGKVNYQEFVKIMA